MSVGQTRLPADARNRNRIAHIFVSTLSMCAAKNTILFFSASSPRKRNVCMTSSFLFIPFFFFSCPGKRGGFRYPNRRYARISIGNTYAPTRPRRTDWITRLFFPAKFLYLLSGWKLSIISSASGSCRYHQCRRWECAPYVHIMKANIDDLLPRIPAHFRLIRYFFSSNRVYQQQHHHHP